MSQMSRIAKGLHAHMTGPVCVPTRVATGMARSRVSLMFSGQGAWAAPERGVICLPEGCVGMRTAGELDAELEVCAWGLLAHESGHVGEANVPSVEPDPRLQAAAKAVGAEPYDRVIPFTGFLEDLDRRSRVAAHVGGWGKPEVVGKQVLLFHNAIEDPRMEGVVVRQYPGAAAWLRGAHAHVDRLEGSRDYPFNLTGVACTLKRMVEGGELPPATNLCRRLLERDDLLAVVERYRLVAVEDPRPGGWIDAANAALAIRGLLAAGAIPEEDSEKGEGGQREGGEPGTGGQVGGSVEGSGHGERSGSAPLAVGEIVQVLVDPGGYGRVVDLDPVRVTPLDPAETAALGLTG